jgi:hypothetical protein
VEVILPFFGLIAGVVTSLLVRGFLPKLVALLTPFVFLALVVGFFLLSDVVRSAFHATGGQ